MKSRLGNGADFFIHQTHYRYYTRSAGQSRRVGKASSHSSFASQHSCILVMLWMLRYRGGYVHIVQNKFLARMEVLLFLTAQQSDTIGSLQRRGYVKYLGWRECYYSGDGQQLSLTGRQISNQNIKETTRKSRN